MRLAGLILVAAMPVLGDAAEVLLPAGTTVYAQLQQRLTSKKGIHRDGDPARAIVWRDVVVDGYTVIPQGTSIRVNMTNIRPKRLRDRRGSLELEALNVNASDGSIVELDGGYDASGNDRVALSSSLRSALSWSVTVLKGKEAVLPPGTLFDAQVKVSKSVSVSTPRVAASQDKTFAVDILYDNMADKEEFLPLQITRCGIVIGDASVVTVNDSALEEPIPVDILSSRVDGACVNYRGRIELRRLGRQLSAGINRFEIDSQDSRVEVILAVEL